MRTVLKYSGLMENTLKNTKLVGNHPLSHSADFNMVLWTTYRLQNSPEQTSLL